MGLAEGFEIRVLVGQLLQVVIQFDGPPDVTVGGGEITPLSRIATQIELDQRILGMQGGGLGKNFGGGFERVTPAFGKSPRHKPAGLVGMGGGQFGGEGSGIRPALGSFQKPEPEFHHAPIGGHGGGEMIQFIQGIIDHAEVGIPHCAFGALEIFFKLNQPAHPES